MDFECGVKPQRVEQNGWQRRQTTKQKERFRGPTCISLLKIETLDGKSNHVLTLKARGRVATGCSKTQFFRSTSVTSPGGGGDHGSSHRKWSSVILASDSRKGRAGREGVYWPKKLKHLLGLLTAFWLSSAAGHLVVDRFFSQQFKTMQLKQISHFQSTA